MEVKGYKVFNSDWTCRGFQYEVGKTYEMKDKPELCEKGFHFCEKAAYCFNYYEFNPDNKVAEVLALGDIVTGNNKSCTNKIQIIREIPWAEVLEIVNAGKGCTGIYNSGNHNSGDCNSGDWNSGNHNSGDCNSSYCNSGNWNSGNNNSGSHNSGNNNSGSRNSGDCNSGNWNSGDYNSGYYNSGKNNIGNHNSGYYNSGIWNSGNWNSGDRNSGNHNSGKDNSGDWNKCNFSNGCFNTIEPKIYLFNKPSEWTYRDWLNSTARGILNHIPKNVLEHIPREDMSDKEKKAHPEAEVTGGYLKELDTSECAITWWCSLSENEKKTIMSIPNFDKAIFKEITGIDIKED